MLRKYIFLSIAATFCVLGLTAGEDSDQGSTQPLLIKISKSKAFDDQGSTQPLPVKINKNKAFESYLSANDDRETCEKDSCEKCKNKIKGFSA